MATYQDEFIISHGKRLSYSATVDGTYTLVEDTIEIDLPEAEIDETEVTTDSTPNYTKAFLMGLIDPGSISFTYRYSVTQFAALETIFALARTTEGRESAVRFWKVTLPDGSTAIVKGWLKKHALPVGSGSDSPEVECEIRCTGAMTFTPAAGD